jgi:hypothetical protein
MDIQVTQEQGRVPVTVFRLDGDLDVNSSGLLEERALQAISGGVEYLLLDLSCVPYMSSAGITAINQVFNMLRNLPDGEDEDALKTVFRDGKYKSRRLKLLKPSRQVQYSLSTAGVDLFLEVHADLGKAVKSF